MNVNKRKLLVMDLALALIVFTLFAMAPKTTSNSRHADLDLNRVESDVGKGNGVVTSRITDSRTPLVSRVSIETNNGSTGHQ